MAKFHWTPECEKAFQGLTQHLSNLPRLAIPKSGEHLYLYVASSSTAISAVLVQEERRELLPVYFFSRGLHDAELRYHPLEKLALALVYAARKLRPYFQSHPIKVLTDSPLRQVLLKPKASGRLMKWVVELGEQDIEYCPRKVVKGQAVTDFLAETSSVGEHSTVVDERPTAEVDLADTWKMYVDGSSTKGKCGVGVVLISPEGIALQYALRFDFDTTTNEVEYEALLVGLNIASRLKAQILLAYSDSQIIVNQVHESYQTKGDHLKKYLDLVREKIREFRHFQI